MTYQSAIGPMVARDANSQFTIFLTLKCSEILNFLHGLTFRMRMNASQRNEKCSVAIPSQSVSRFSYLKNLPLTIQTRVSVFVISLITNVDMVMFTWIDAT